MATQVLDVRPLPPARRHAAIFERWRRLPVDAAFELISDHDPLPLYYQFQAEQAGKFTWSYVDRGPDTWRVRIGRQKA